MGSWRDNYKYDQADVDKLVDLLEANLNVCESFWEKGNTNWEKQKEICRDYWKYIKLMPHKLNDFHYVLAMEVLEEKLWGKIDGEYTEKGMENMWKGLIQQILAQPNKLDSKRCIELLKTYEKNEAKNLHLENARLLAENFGTPFQRKRMYEILAKRNK
tara:strand:+ start:2703 stop:3179 length:477 start_codon:yes stop_codon:yes gene_type:complete